MRNENAVSDIIGAVILIGVVMGGIGIVGVMLLSTVSPEETPKASISSYCVRCDFAGTYEIIMYHGGGESLSRNGTRFYLYTTDGKMEEMVPWWVYDSTPEDCMYTDIGDSSLSARETWYTSDSWKSGQSLRFRFSTDDVPSVMEVRHYPFKSPMVRAEFNNNAGNEKGNKIRNSTCVADNNPAGCTDPTGELIPNLKKVTPCSPGECLGDMCQAEFTYNLTSGSYTIPVHKSGKPWNYLQGSGTTGTREEFTAAGSETDVVVVNFSSEVVWWLGRTKSMKGTCTI